MGARPRTLAAVLAFALAGVVMPARAAWALAFGATVFAVVGFLVGLKFTLADPSGRTGDIAYHLAGLALLLVSATLLALPQGRVALTRRRGGITHRELAGNR